MKLVLTSYLHRTAKPPEHKLVSVSSLDVIFGNETGLAYLLRYLPSLNSLLSLDHCTSHSIQVVAVLGLMISNSAQVVAVLELKMNQVVSVPDLRSVSQFKLYQYLD